jgi:hypothetical protein
LPRLGSCYAKCEVQTNKVPVEGGEIRREAFEKPRGISSIAEARARLIWQTVALFLPLTFQVYGQANKTTTDPAEITTRTGVTYKFVRILEAAPDGLEIEFTPPGGGIGMTRIQFKDLPADLQQKYGYDGENAIAYTTERAKEQAAVAAKM